MAQQKTEVSKLGIDLYYDASSYCRLLADSGRVYLSSVVAGNKLVLTSDLISATAGSSNYATNLGVSGNSYNKAQLDEILNKKYDAANISNASVKNSQFTTYLGSDTTGYTKDSLTTALGTKLDKTTYSSGSVFGIVKTSTGITNNSGTISVTYGSTAGTACQGNDSRLSNSRPASDVYKWAKAENKPSYTFTEIGIPALTNNSGKILSNNGTSLTWKTEYSYTLPAATSSVLGGVKTGTGLTNSSGLISVTYGSAANTACQGNDSRLSDARACPNGLTIQTNGTTKLSGWTGSSAGSINITYSDVGAAASSHSHSYLPLSGGTISGNLTVNGDISGYNVYGAVWQDYADAVIVQNDLELIPGKAYAMDEDGSYRLTNCYKDSKFIGIHSDTYGYLAGDNEGNLLKTAVAGYVLAYVDKQYPVGTPLTVDKDGNLTEFKNHFILVDEFNNIGKRMKDPETYRVCALYWKPESKKEIKANNRVIIVNGRHWVKIK